MTTVPSTPPTEKNSVDRRLLASSPWGRRSLGASVVVGLGLTASLIAQALLLAHLFGWVMTRRPGPFPAVVVVWLVLMFGARILLSALSDLIATSAGRRATAQLRRDLGESFDAMGPVGLADQKTGALALNATRGITALQPYFARYLPAVVVALLAPPTVLVTLGILDWPSALIAIALLAVLPFAMIRFGRQAARESERQWRRLSSLSGRMVELLRGLPTLRALGQSERGRHEVESASQAVAESVNDTLRAALLSTAALEFLAGVGVGLVAMLAGLRLLHGSISIVAALSVILLTPEVFLPLRRAGGEFHASTEGRAAAETMFALIDAAPSTDERSLSLTAATPLRVVDLSVRYDHAERNALGPCSFTLGTGEHLIVSGPSGCGKSTLLMTLTGSLSPRSGFVEMGGQDLSSVAPASLAHFVSYVPQRPHIFSWSLAENLALGEDHDPEELLAVLDLVALGHLASSSDGLHRPLAEYGRSMSGGERQRIGLARAVLQNRPLVLLDEPAAHLDERTLNALRHALNDWLGQRSVLEVTHRPGLVNEAPVLTILAQGSDR